MNAQGNNPGDQERNAPEGSAAAAAGPDGGAARLTPEDILNTAQNDAAKAASESGCCKSDAGAGESAAAESACEVGEGVAGAASGDCAGETAERETCEKTGCDSETGESAAGDCAGETCEQGTCDSETDQTPAADPLNDSANPYLEDLRRITAEYANYRKRTEDNLELEQQRATAKVVLPLLGVLDDFDRAEKHGDIAEGSAVAAIASKLRSSLEKLGLESYGETGAQFDPQQHEAIAQVPVPGAEPNSIIDVIEPGYRIGGVELRPAKVAVAVAADG